MSIRNLELRARTVVEGSGTGCIARRITASRLNSRIPALHAGDDPRYLDWKLAGRTDRYF